MVVTSSTDLPPQLLINSCKKDNLTPAIVSVNDPGSTGEMVLSSKNISGRLEFISSARTLTNVWDEQTNLGHGMRDDSDCERSDE